MEDADTITKAPVRLLLSRCRYCRLLFVVHPLGILPAPHPHVAMELLHGTMPNTQNNALE